MASVLAPIIRTAKPGPGAYASEKIDLKQSPPEYSFGIRHSKWAFDEDMIRMVIEDIWRMLNSWLWWWCSWRLNLFVCSDMCMGHDLCQGNQLVRCRIEAFQQNSQIFHKCLLLYNFSPLSYFEQTLKQTFPTCFL